MDEKMSYKLFFVW